MSESELPPGYAEWLEEDTFERAAYLAEERRFGEAAPVALDAAMQYLRRGFRVRAFDAYGAAGKFFHLDGDCGSALDAFERAFGLFERDAVYLTGPSLVIARLASWPELYARAAIAALDDQDPVRAIGFAETGRARAITSRIGPGRAKAPRGAPPDTWSEYVRLWRLAVAHAANDLVDAAQASTFNAYDAELAALRRILVEAGAAPEDLAPLTPRFDPAVAAAALAEADHPTVVLYSIRLHDSVRFIRAAADGIQEIVLAPREQATVVGAADAYVDALRSEPGRLVAKVEKHLPVLLDCVRPALQPVLDEALDGANGGRLLWIPHASLVAIPLLACQTEGGLVADRVAVSVAPSLSFGLESLQPDVTVRRSAAAVFGRTDGDEAPTDGGERLLVPLVGSAVRDHEPRSLAALEHAVGAATVAQVTCHGVYDWNDPLRSYLKLGAGFDLPIADLFDSSVFASDSLVIFGACDSGTVAQTEINEAIGVPVAAMAAGARTVVGAAWPVRHVVAVGICAHFIRELARGAASPEALKAASIWIRDATYASLLAEVDALGHPLADQLRRIDPARRGVRPFGRPEMWASYVHWGRGWRAEPVEP